jgi:hypothetical protein
MAKTVTVHLTKPIVTHHGDTVSIELREPTGREFLEIGEPFTWQRPVGGEPVMIEVPGVLQAYAERCLTRPGPEFMVQLGLADMMRVKDALTGFFGDAQRAAFPDPSTSSSTSSASSAPESGSASP